MSDELYERVAKVFQGVLTEQEFAAFNPEASMDDVEGWDSLSFLDVIMALEGEFNVRIDGLDAASLTSVASILAYLRNQS